MLPKPFYDQNGTTIYHGDCAEILPYIDPVDLLLTDPPYGMEYQSNRRKIKLDKIHGDKSLPCDIILLAMEKANCASYVFMRWDTIGEMPKPKSILVWAKNNWTSGDLEHEHGRMWEACLYYPGPKHKFTKRTPDVIFCEKTGNIHHPTEKPIGLISILLGAYEHTAHSILDPFMGSGTTLVAAKNMGKRAIGIERELKYCEIAVRRLAQQTLFQVEQSNSPVGSPESSPTDLGGSEGKP